MLDDIRRLSRATGVVLSRRLAILGFLAGAIAKEGIDGEWQ